METLKILGLYIVAALCEIAGAYLVWQWRREGKPALLALFGLGALFLYSFIQTIQELNFGRAFAAYGGIFIAVALLWGWFVDGHVPDTGDWAGVITCLVGVGIILVTHRP